MKTIDTERKRNQYAANCCECQTEVHPLQGWLYQDTNSAKASNRLRNRGQKTWKVKCEACHSGETERKQKEIEKAAKGKTLSVTFAKKWVNSLDLKVQRCDQYGHYIEVSFNDKVLLGLCPLSGQEYPSEGWCEDQGTELGGKFSQQAIDYVCENLTNRIENLRVFLSKFAQAVEASVEIESIFRVKFQGSEYMCATYLSESSYDKDLGANPSDQDIRFGFFYREGDGDCFCDHFETVIESAGEVLEKLVN